MKKNKVLTSLFGIMCVVFGGMVFACNNVSAARTISEVYAATVDKAVYQGVYKCYTNGFIKNSINPLNSYITTATLMAKDDSRSYENYIPLVTGIGDNSLFKVSRFNIKDGGLSCNQLFTGYGGGGGSSYDIFSATGHTPPSIGGNTEQTTDFMTNMGYEVVKTSGDDETDTCYALSYKKYLIGYSQGNKTSATTNSVCQFRTTGNLYTQGTTMSQVGTRFLNEGFFVESTSSKKVGFGPMGTKTVDLGDNEFNGEWLMSVIGSICGGNVCSSSGYTGTGYAYEFEISVDTVVSEESLYEYAASFSDSAKAASTAISFLSDGKYNAQNIAIEGLEKRVLYQDYLTSYYGVEVNCNADSGGFYERGKKLNWFDTSSFTMKQCAFRADESSGKLKKMKDKKVNGIDGNGLFQYESINNYKELMDIIDDALPTEYTEEEVENIRDVVNEGREEAESVFNLSDRCSEGSGALGWILCSALDLMSKASAGMYNNYIKPALNIEPKLFVSDSGTSNTWIAWQTFQGFANILFIILLLVVIFSQLTGVGIDNYGIKKILPKLIIGAVLVNLSYFICEICVDISNIVGNGIQALFSGLSQASEFTVEGTTVSAAPGNTLVAVGVLGAAVGIAAIVANPAMLLSLFVSAIGIVISIFFIFILLSAREAAVVVLIVLSPLAFACYMLPNTKKLFDRWIKIWKGLLLVYPICGLLVGGGDYVSRLLMTIGSGSFFMAFTAMIAGVVPIFFLPTILKSSFAALGNLGSKISGIGQRLGNKAMSGARSSEAYKNASRMGLERRTRIKAGLDKNGNLTKRGERMAKRANSGLGRLVGADKRRANYIAAAKKDIAGSVAAGSTLTSTLARTGISQTDEALVLNDGNGGTEELFGARTEGAYYGNQFIEAAQKGNQRGMNAAIESMKKSGMKTKDIAKLLRFAQNGGYLDHMSDVDKAAWMRDMFQQHGDVLATDFELKHFMRSGGSANGGRLGNYGDYAMTAPIKMDEVVPEDFLRMSGDSIAGLAKAGILDQTMAQRIMAMNPNISADKKIMIGAIASGQIWGGIERNSDGYAIKADGTVAESARDVQFVSGATVKDASTFKKDAETLSRNHNAGGSTSTMRGVNGSMVEAWASATPQAVNVVQNFTAGGGQYNPVEVTPWGGGAGRAGEIRPVEVPDHTADATLRGRTTTGGLRMEEGDSFEELGPINTNNIQPIETPETPTRQSNVAQQRLDSMRQNLSSSNNSTAQPVSTRQAAPVVTPESAAATNVSQQRLNDMRNNLSRPSSSNSQSESAPRESAPRESAPRPASTGFDTNITPAERSILGSEREMRGATQDTVRRVESQIRAQAPASAPAPAPVQAQAPVAPVETQVSASAPAQAPVAPVQAQAPASAPAQAPAAQVRAQAQVAPTQAPVAPVQTQAPASAPAQAPAAPARARAQVAPARAQAQVAPARASVTSAQSSTLASAQAPVPAPAQNSRIITGPNIETLARDAKRQFDARQSSNRNWSGNSVIKTK